MEIDLYQEYKNLPVPELVKVARSPWDYLPEAVAAATQVLNERGIPVEEIDAEEWALAQKEMSEALAKKRFGDYFNWVQELLPSSAGEGPASRPWIYLFLLAYAVYYVFKVYLNIKIFVSFARCEVCRDTGVVTLTCLAQFAFLTASLFLLLKQKPLGWAFVLVHAVATSLNAVLAFYGLYAHHAYLPVLLITYILPLLISIGVIIFFWLPWVMEFFSVSRKYGNVAVFVAVLLAMILAVFKPIY